MGLHKKLSIVAARAIEEAKQKKSKSKGFFRNLFNQKSNNKEKK